MKNRILLGLLALAITAIPSVASAQLSASCYPAIGCPAGQDPYGPGKLSCQPVVNTVAADCPAPAPGYNMNFSCERGCFQTRIPTPKGCPTMNIDPVGPPPAHVVNVLRVILDDDGANKLWNCADNTLQNLADIGYWQAGVPADSIHYSDGRVGMGTNDPQSQAHIRGNTGPSYPQWTSFNYGAALILDGFRNNGLAILDGTGGNPISMVNAGGSMFLGTGQPALSDTTTDPKFNLRLDPDGYNSINRGWGADQELHIQAAEAGLGLAEADPEATIRLEEQGNISDLWQRNDRFGIRNNGHDAFNILSDGRGWFNGNGGNAGLWVTTGGSSWFMGQSGGDGDDLRFHQGGDRVKFSSSSTEPRVQIMNNVGSGSFDDWDDYQLLLYRSGSGPANSYGLGIEGSTMVFNSNDDYRFHDSGQNTVNRVWFDRGHVKAREIGNFYWRYSRHYCLDTPVDLSFASTWGCLLNYNGQYEDRCYGDSESWDNSEDDGNSNTNMCKMAAASCNAGDYSIDTVMYWWSSAPNNPGAHMYTLWPGWMQYNVPNKSAAPRRMQIRQLCWSPD